jgi:hypothetical protein
MTGAWDSSLDELDRRGREEALSWKKSRGVGYDVLA